MPMASAVAALIATTCCSPSTINIIASARAKIAVTAALSSVAVADTRTSSNPCFRRLTHATGSLIAIHRRARPAS